MNINDLHTVYFIGIGGIGMSALARYCNHIGMRVSGYDRTATNLTDALIQEGIEVHFEDDVAAVPKNAQLVVYTPAVSANHNELNYCRNNGFVVKKRAEALGYITQNCFTIAVAGTHGKTTVSSMIAHLLKSSGYDCTAFVGGIMANYNTNFLLGNNNVVVVEADEYDRSFLHLIPDVAVVTATDADHLDIYGSAAAITETFELFAKQVKNDGLLVVQHDLELKRLEKEKTLKSYSLSDKTAASVVVNFEANNKQYVFDMLLDEMFCEKVILNMGGKHNVENALAAATVAKYLGITAEDIKKGLQTFKGIKRRFEYQIDTENLVMIDDYAHHPTEINALMGSVKQRYPNKHVTIVFQPHLYSRTRDFADGFAESLSNADRVMVLDVYPARELPIKGVNAKMLFDKITIKDKYWCEKSNLLQWVDNQSFEVLVVAGAGDIDKLVEPIKNILIKKYEMTV